MLSLRVRVSVGLLSQLAHPLVFPHEGQRERVGYRMKWISLVSTYAYEGDSNLSNPTNHRG